MSGDNNGKKDNSVYIEHMLDSIIRIDEYVESKELFYDSHLVQDAVVRNVLVHDYLGIDLDVIWSVVELELPKLEKALTSINLPQHITGR